MSKFKAGDAVERLEYDFTDFGGNAGTIPEPSRGQVKAYFNGIKNLMKEVKDLRGMAENIDPDKMSDEEVADLMSKVDEAEERSDDYHERSVGLLAELCGADKVDLRSEESEEPITFKYVGGSPTFDELQALPFRVLQAFTQWFIQEIQPKKTTPGTTR